MYFYVDINTLTVLACIMGGLCAVAFFDRIHKKHRREQEAKKHFKNQ